MAAASDGRNRSSRWTHRILKQDRAFRAVFVVRRTMFDGMERPWGMNNIKNPSRLFAAVNRCILALATLSALPAATGCALSSDPEAQPGDEQVGTAPSALSGVTEIPAQKTTTCAASIALEHWDAPLPQQPQQPQHQYRYEERRPFAFLCTPMNHSDDCCNAAVLHNAGYISRKVLELGPDVSCEPSGDGTYRCWLY
jgi:hypothetical protein